MNQSMIQKHPLASDLSLYDSNEEKAKQDTEYQPQQIQNENDEENDHFDGEFSFEKLIMETHQIKEARMQNESGSEDIEMWDSQVKQESDEEGQDSSEYQSPVEVNYQGQITSKMSGIFRRKNQDKKNQKRNKNAKPEKSEQQESSGNQIMSKMQNSNLSSKYSKRISNRKIRTTVSQEKIKIMEHLFPYIQKCIPYKGTTLSLKDVAKIVNLGYSTILHKYKDYRRKGQVEKGLLLKFKDVKRKYGKSLVIQNAIKCALAQRTFKTAKQLAAYIRETNQMNVNRSIISRHLNQMQREKQEYLVQKEISESQTEETQQQLSRQLKNFSKLYFGLKEKQFKCFYFSVIRLYFVEGKLLEELGDDNRKAYEIINLAVTSTQDQLVNYYPNVEIMEELNDMTKRRGFTAESAYKTLYEEVMNKIQEESMVEHVPGNEKTYVLFPYRWDLHKQYEYRKKVLKPFLAAKLNILVTPPRLNGQGINFIQIWVQNEVLPKLKDFHFKGIEQMKEELLHTMNHSQKRLRKYANEMAFNIKKFQ